jgi:FkbH-like protein
MSRPALKAIVADLDNTLYFGVVGEDGADGVVLTEGHRKLQGQLKQLRDQGFFLCIASKNDRRDINALFAKRADFPLRVDDFTKICASWSSKAVMIAEIAEFLNIHTSAMLFIDDNIGELQTASASYPDLRLLMAYPDAEQTSRALKNYPGLLKLSSTSEDLLRGADVQANERRAALKSTMSREEYLRSLDVKLTFSADNLRHAERVAELAGKTNQFIFSYKRYKRYEVEALARSGSAAVVTVAMKDKLCDSGVIGACVGVARDSYAEIEELFVSCRALGRGLDDVIALGAIAVVCEKLGADKVKIDFVRGERNTPARRFFDAKLKRLSDGAALFSYKFPENTVTIKKEFC